MEALGLEHLMDVVHQPDAASQQRVRDALAECFLACTQAEWVRFFEGRDVAFAPALPFEEALLHPQVKARGMCLEDAQGVVHLNTPLRLVREPAAPRLCVPAPGEHRAALDGAPTDSFTKDLFIRRAAIVKPVRTSVGTFGGSLRAVPVERLGASVVQAVIERSGIDPARIEDLVFAQSYASGETPCIGRWLALQAGLPVEVPGMQLDRRCGGGLQAVATAAMMIQSGTADVVLAGGVESMSNVEYYTTDMRWGSRAGSVRLHDRLERGRERSQPEERFGRISGMIETAENLAREFKITREQADEYAVQSHRRAAAAWDAGRFAEELVPVAVPQRKGDPLLVARDEGLRPETSTESLARLKPIMQGGTVTAGNSSQQNDAASACLGGRRRQAARTRPGAHGLSAAGRQRAVNPPPWVSARCRPCAS